MSLSSVTTWINRLRDGNQEAAAPLWQRYYGQLVRLARDHLDARVRRAFDEEDVALSAFNSFCAGAEAGRFPDIRDRRDLWRLLVAITLCNVRDRVRRENAQRRGGRDNPLPGDVLDLPEEALQGCVSAEPDPALAAAVADELEHLMNRLPEELRPIARALLAGYTPGEIADGLGCCERTVQRRRELIRQCWREQAEGEDVRD